MATSSGIRPPSGVPTVPGDRRVPQDEGELLRRENLGLGDLLPRPRPADEVSAKRGRKPSPADSRQKPTSLRLLPMQLRPGDHLTDSTVEWEVVGRPFTTAGGKNAHLRLQRVNQPGVTDIRTWGAHEKVSVRRP